MDAHDDQIRAPFSGLPEHLPIRSAFDDGRLHRALRAGVLRNQLMQLAAGIGNGRFMKAGEVEIKNRRLLAQDQRELRDMQQRESCVGFLGHGDRIRQRVEGAL